jgi:Arc/MetJ family transcription regulator
MMPRTPDNMMPNMPDSSATARKDKALQAPLLRTLESAEAVILGKPRQLRLALVCLLAGGHLLIEDIPGIGKTTLAQAVSAPVPRQGGKTLSLKFMVLYCPWFHKCIIGVRIIKMLHIVYCMNQMRIAMRTNIVLDDALVQEAMKYTHAKSKREVVDLALRELVNSHERRQRLEEFFGSDVIDPDYDYKAARVGEAR